CARVRLAYSPYLDSW
nr:immunoglobulin heavy chain junction region [Macaca mulatta]